MGVSMKRKWNGAITKPNRKKVKGGILLQIKSRNLFFTHFFELKNYFKLQKKGMYFQAIFSPTKRSRNLHRKHKRILPLTFFRGFVTVEVALVVPLFLLAVISILSILNAYEKYLQTEMKLYTSAKDMAILGYSAPEQVIGTRGDYIDLKLPYSFSIPGLYGKPLRLENHCFVHIFNGYNPAMGDQAGAFETYVYLTKEGVVYHKKRSCSHINVTISKVAGAKVDKNRNLDGAKYGKCAYCCRGYKKTELRRMDLYITEYGRNYHTKLNCPNLKRMVEVVKLSEVHGLPACKSCGG